MPRGIPNTASDKATHAQHVPNVMRDSAHVEYCTDDFQHADWEGYLDMTAEAPGARAIEIASDIREFSDNLEYERFMEMPVGIIISEAMHEREERVVPAGCNGDQKFYPRGIPIKVRRCVLERLLRATVTEQYIQPLHDPNLDEPQRQLSKNVPAYHINVKFDPHPLGARWAARMRREGC